ncbi:hypothetical protein M427DRAFT_60216 [Gonapodya prolifera JEL478]|uniref:Mitochondrial import inner membrane translocase subunit n=1 Tax=Gonapodya prolifera (strain JEL478) TaxID=1344416 RepID=A0A139A4N6_GONPJ|nr:hypothetical protein M427DRAFT_60216 [Gonapodya prolifera JEL478]|eukprot:KXS11767.1 hypothetical protein M427DRAFT_60216 [Gonapodya prolifera JEL478]
MDQKRIQAIQEQVRQEVAVANFQDLLQRINTKCFAKCITKPGPRLDGSEEVCLSRCTERYIEAWNVVSSTLKRRMEREGPI